MNFLYQKLRSVLLLLILVTPLVETFNQEDTPVSISGNYENFPVIEFLSLLDKNFNLKCYYKPEWLKDKIFSADFNQNTLEQALSQIFEGTAYEYEIVQGNHIVILPRENVAVLKGKMFDYSNNLYQSRIHEIGDPSEAGKFKMVKLSGKITDGKNGEPVFGTTVWIENTNNAVVSNAEGKYSLNIAPGIYSVQFSNMGFEKSTYTLKVISNGTFDIELFQETHNITEVAVYAKDAERNIKSSQMSIVELNAKALKQLPSLIGEKDILKSFTTMPGVQSVGEFGSGFNVRGGGEDQNLYLLEGAPIFNTSHVFGMLSVINPDVVKEVSLYKGHIPSEYGERVSSVMDIKMNENGIFKVGAKGGIGIYNSRLMLQVPLLDNKITLKIAGRSSYSNWLLKKLPDYNLQNSSTSFYDLTATAFADFKRNKISLFAYKSFDDFKYVKQYAYNYGNELASLSWRSIFSSNFTGRLLVAYSNYKVTKDNYGYGQDAESTSSELSYLSGKYHLNFTRIQNNNIEAGIQTILYQITPGDRLPLTKESDVKPFYLEKEQSLEKAVYINDKIDISNKLSFNIGLRYSNYTAIGPKKVYFYEDGLPRNFNFRIDSINYAPGEKIQSYQNLEPRVSAKIQTTDNSSVKISYNRNTQYISLLSYTSIPTPDDIWKLSDKHIKPVKANQFALGYYRNINKNTIETSVEVYYKMLDNLPEFKNNSSTDTNVHIETELLSTKGKNYGVELMIKKNSGVLEGWVSYTYSRAFRQTSGLFSEEIINNNSWYKSSYDKPHNLSVVSTYHINKRWRLTGTFNYSTGRAITLPEYKYTIAGQELIHYSPRNKYRLPDYHRLDIALSIDESLRRSKKWKGSWTFSIINVYARKNAYSVFYKKEEPTFSNNYKQYSLYKLYIIGIPLPTVTYNFIF